MVATRANLIAKAASNAWAVTFGGGIEEHKPFPSTVLFDEPHRLLRRYDIDGATGNPILLVPPLAVPASCFDLRPGQSLVAHLAEAGRPVYLVDFGWMSFADRGMGFEDFIDDIVPTAVRRVSADHGGADVDIVTWSLGGTVSLLCAAAHPDLPLRSISAIGTPIDYFKNPSVTALRAIGKYTGGNLVPVLNRVTGGPAAPFVQLGFRAMAFQRELTKPLWVARNILDDEALARMHAIERFIGAMPGYPGRLYNQMYTRLLIRNELAQGKVRFGDRTIDLGAIAVPVLAVGATADNIAPHACVEAITSVVNDVRFETVPGSHLGMIAGPDAESTTWKHVDSFLADLDAERANPAPRK